MRTGRWLVVVVLLVLASIGPGRFVALSQEGAATLTIHHRYCPVGIFGDLYTNCHEVPQTPGVTIWLGGAESRRGLTDGDGNVTFSDLMPGAYFTGDDRPGSDFTRHHVFCSAAETPGIPRPAGLSAIILAAGDDVVCDWYVTNPDMSGDAIQTPVATQTPPPPLPAGTAIVVASWLCPDHYVELDYAAMCRTTPGAQFRYWTRDVGALEAPEAGVDGTVRFDLAGSTNRREVIAVGQPEGTGRYFAAVVDCVVGEIRLHADPLDTLSGYHMVAVSVAPGEEVRCDWYNVPYGSD